VPALPVPRSHPMPALPPAKTDKEATAE
jgi:hypothetical protein